MPKLEFILNEIELVYRPIKTLGQRPTIDNPDAAHHIFRENWDSLKIGFVEEFKIMLLNRANKVLGISALSKGGTTGTIADPKIIFGLALKSAASHIIVAHNHPSGIMKASNEDIALTQKLKDAGEILGINLIDHLVLSGIDQNYCSILDHCPF